MYDDNCFITLTYNEENLPKDGTLVHRDFQLFMKKLRKKYGSGIRFYMCGEYGTEQDEEKYHVSKIGRPHYHACIFNFDFPDKELFKTVNDFRLYTSEALQKLWGKGHCIIGDVTFESAAYVARYIVKKQKGPDKDEYYHRINPETGEMFKIKEEYTTMSRRPGIANEWWQQFKEDTYKDFVTLRGVKMKPPRYYDSLLEKDNPDLLNSLKEGRVAAALTQLPEQDCDRRRVRQDIKFRQIKRLRRDEL